jgi:uncharacterized protein
MSFLQGIQQFNQRQFYECHDTLEAIWIEAPEMDKRFYQGILQVAVACHHLSNHNLRGAIILLGEGIKRLSDYEPDYQGIDVTQLIEESACLLETLQQLDTEQINSFVAQIFSGTEKPDRTAESCQLPKLAIL